MGVFSKRISFFLVLLLLPVTVFCQKKGINIESRAEMLSLFELVLVVTSFVALKQYFFPGLVNRTPFHIFHLLFVIVFYWIALTFMVNNKSFFEGYGALSNREILIKYFTSTDPWVLFKRIIIVAFLVDILYIIRYWKDYFIDG